MNETMQSNMSERLDTTERRRRWTGVHRHVLAAGRNLLRERQKGQSLIIIIFALIGLLAFVGLGIDLGLVYVERVRVGRAADAAALAAVAELTLEEAAHARALSYLHENGYPFGPDVRIVINGGPPTGTVQGPPPADARTIIWIDTAFSRDFTLPPAQQLNTASRIRVRVLRQVPMTFLQFIGFRQFPVEATAEAENITSLDIALVYDRSGSMEFDTLCYGCWERQGLGGCTNPDGCIYPLQWSGVSTMTAAHCATSTTYVSYTYGSVTFNRNDFHYRRTTSPYPYYIVIEAEEYSYMREEADYHTWNYTPYKTFWVVQRNQLNYDYSPPANVGSTGRDSRGGYISHHPFAAKTDTQGGLGAGCTWGDLVSGEYCRRNWPDGSPVVGGPFPAPRVDYDFNAPIQATYYFWIRGQGGGWSDNNHYIFWGVDQSPTGQESNFPRGAYYDGAVTGSWNWRCLGSASLTTGMHTLNLWAGGAGFDVDRIVITTNSANCGADSDPPDSSGGLPANNARTRWACHPCDPRFAGLPGGRAIMSGTLVLNYLPNCNVGANPDQSKDAIYTGEQPIRAALNAARGFVGRMDPYFDQVGYVRYSSGAEIANQLECLRRRETCTRQVITDTVDFQLRTTDSAGSTNIAGGILNGIEVLRTTGPCDFSTPLANRVRCGRPGAAHIMVLMTDGEANVTPDSTCYSGTNAALWPPPYDTGDTIDRAKDCVIYYARQARQAGIVIYAISLGESADQELMIAVADIGGGTHYYAPNAQTLDQIFDELFKNIFLRLIR